MVHFITCNSFNCISYFRKNFQALFIIIIVVVIIVITIIFMVIIYIYIQIKYDQLVNLISF
jgi:uncharacterized BrkB/YihY/UPF0761 family membrane protein